MSQEVFDYVATHLFKQGRPAQNSDHDCVYRHVDDQGILTCAVGCLISEYDYSPMMEGMSIMNLIQNFSSLGCLEEDYSLLIDLQKTHDQMDELGFPINNPSWNSTDAMRTELTTVAHRNGLSADVLETLAFADR